MVPMECGNSLHPPWFRFGGVEYLGVWHIRAIKIIKWLSHLPPAPASYLTCPTPICCCRRRSARLSSGASHAQRRRPVVKAPAAANAGAERRRVQRWWRVLGWENQGKTYEKTGEKRMESWKTEWSSSDLGVKLKNVWDMWVGGGCCAGGGLMFLILN